MANSLSDVVVATDDERIQKAVIDFGGKALLTSGLHKTGTDRCAETVEKLFSHFDAAINIQGDEPYIHPEQIDELAECFGDNSVQIATLIKKINFTEDLMNKNRIKVVVDKNMNALYFSRSPIPFFNPGENSPGFNPLNYYKHIGIYGYRINVLKQLTELKQSSLEIAESLEQLRWLENGYKIKTRITDLESVSIDVPEDLKKLINFAN